LIPYISQFRFGGKNTGWAYDDIEMLQYNYLIWVITAFECNFKACQFLRLSALVFFYSGSDSE